MKYQDVTFKILKFTLFFYSTQLLAEALQALVRSLRERANPRQSPFGVQICLTGAPDIRVIMCMFCGDSYNVGSLISPLFTLPACQQSGDRTISLLTFLGEKRRYVQVTLLIYTFLFHFH